VDEPLRIANASGFYGDRFSAVREMLAGGPIDVLTGDYLAELTMLILGRDRAKDPARGYARTFLRQLEENLGLAKDLGVKIVANAGGVNPAGLAEAVRALADKLGLDVAVAHVEGDDLLPRTDEFGFGESVFGKSAVDTSVVFGKPVTANAYLGAWGIRECLLRGADVVVTGRVTDASLVVGPAAAHFGWSPDDYDAIAGAMVAGHVIECGAQATGGNYAFFTELGAGSGQGFGAPGFPVAEVYADGSSVITKHPGTGGAVTVGTVTAQLVYEIASARYAGPDATARFDTVTLTEDGPDRVRITGTRGEPPPPTLKVCLNALGGFRNEATFVLTGLDIEAKVALVRDQLTSALGDRPPAEVRWMLARTDHQDAETEERASALLHCAVKDAEQSVVGRAFSAAAVELALASYPGFHVTAPPADASPYGVCTAAFVERSRVPHVAVLPDGSRIYISPAAQTLELADVDEPPLPAPLPPGPTRRVPLGTIFGARSGDKASDANLGVWARSDEAWRWLVHDLTVARLSHLLPEAAPLPVRRYVLPNLRALNFVIEGLLGEGVAAQARFDPQAKALGEWLRSRHVDLPEALLSEVPR
jgi:hypothetical protein